MRLLRTLGFTILLICATVLSSFAQYGNDWINFSQKYFKIKIGEEGIYRLDHQSLANAGLPISTIDPHSFSLFRHGIEIPIYIDGEADNSFDAGDFIEFYGYMNTGELDNALYRSPGEQPHQQISLMTDTAIYFLTWNSSTSNQRISTQTNQNYNGKTSDDWIWYRSAHWFRHDFYDGSPYASPGYFSEFTEGEGWFSANIKGNGRTFGLNTPHYNSNGPQPMYEFLLFGKSDPQNTGDIDGNGQNHETESTIDGVLIHREKFRGYKKIFYRDTLNPTLLDPVRTSVKFKSTYLSKSRHAVSYHLIDYPRFLTMDNLSEFSWDYKGGNDYFSFDDYDPAKTQPIVYDLINDSRIIATLSSQTVEFKRANGVQGKIYISDIADIDTISKIEEVDMFPFDPSTTDYSYLMVTHPILDSAAQIYKQYRESPAGGSYKVQIVYTTDLYNTYYYGYHHPMAIRNYIRHIYHQQPNTPEYILMLGKGQVYNLIYGNVIKRDFVDLVPTWGTPPSDYPFVTDLGFTQLSPAIAIGRVPAINNQNIIDYLDKLKLHEQGGNVSKKLIQLTGGSDAQESYTLRSYQDQYYEIARKEYFGANRVIKYKDEAVSVTTSLVEEIQDEINDGSHVVGYFGHGAAQVLEVDIGSPKQLNNKGLYPLFLFEGCALGNSFGSSSLPEQYLFEPDNGAVAWIASSAYGFINELHNWTTHFYTNLYHDNYGESIGHLIQQTLLDYQNPVNNYNRSQCRQMTYHGDPAIKLFAPDKPDYEIVGPVNVTPSDVTAESDSFALNFSIFNHGKSFKSDTPNVYVEVKYNNDSIRRFGPRSFEHVHNSLDVQFYIKNNEWSAGQNQFTIIIDSGNYIDELAPLGEFNNTRLVDFFMPSNSIYPVYPPKDGIINETEVLLQAQNNNLLGSFTDYIFEIDTTPLFNSPLKLNSGPVSGANLIEHRFNLLPFDSLDYFWRVRLDEDDTKWVGSTFSFIYGSENGWSQGYFDKFSESTKSYIELDHNRREFLFSRGNSITHNILVSGGQEPVTTRRMKFGGKDHYPGFLYSGAAAVAINPNSMERFMDSSKYNKYVPKNNWNIDKKYYWPFSRSGAYWFDTRKQEDRDSFVHYLNNIPEGYHIFLYLSGETGIGSWEDTVFQSMELFGAQKIRDIGDGHPYGLFGTKGLNIGEASEVTANYGSPVDPKNQRNNFATLLYPLSPSGSLLSQRVGPAKSWSSFYRIIDPLDNPTEELLIDIYGVEEDETESLLFTDISSKEFNLNTVNADSFPYLRIYASYYDEEELTPAQIGRWSLLYEGVPEGALDPQISLYQNKDTLQEGDTFQVEIAYRNISDLPMDSVLVLSYLLNELNERDTLELKRYAALQTDDYLEVGFKVSTEGMAGDNRIVVSVNPDMDQLEQTLANNIHNFKFYVSNDEKNPLLDVIFDGNHIMDEDIVSHNTVITMSVLDENEFLFIDESTSFNALLTFPDNSEVQLEESLNEISFTPASAPGEKAILEYTGQDLPTGDYHLSVQVADKSGNLSSQLAYEINFKVVRESSISNFYPYPNPFTNSMRFVFTLTGEEMPDQLNIQIMTISGKVVREVGLAELGALKVGHNISDFTWDGTDQFGDKLANGVYLYKVNASLNGEEIKHFETSADALFNQGFGKIYLMR
ncbi:MAG: hypothetical protein JXR19_00630 [Bacteroidia bacterium]